MVRIERLAALGHELRRPEADLLRDGLYELREGWRVQNYPILYFFHGTAVAVLCSGLVKESVVPVAEIERAIARRARFIANPRAQTFAES